MITEFGWCCTLSNVIVMLLHVCTFVVYVYTPLQYVVRMKALKTSVRIDLMPTIHSLEGIVLCEHKLNIISLYPK